MILKHQLKISTIQIDRINDSDLIELNEHGENNRSKEKENEHKNTNHVNSNRTVENELGGDVDSLEIEDINGREQFSSMKVKLKTRKAQLKNDTNAKAAYQCMVQMVPR